MAITFMIVLLPLPDSPMNMLKRLICSKFTFDIEPKFRITRLSIWTNDECNRYHIQFREGTEVLIQQKPEFSGFIAEREGFEPPEVLPSTVFKTAAIDHSAISPKKICLASMGSLRSDRDSNSGYAFGVYTLSRRASSATRASLQKSLQSHLFAFATAKLIIIFRTAKFFLIFFSWQVKNIGIINWP